MTTTPKLWLKILLEHLILMVIGGSLYMGIELLFRGYTHWTMGVLGAICFICIGLLNEIISWQMPFSVQMLCGGVIITSLELLAGLYLNIHMGLDIWDYSDVPLNFMGQICLRYSLAWCVLAAVGIVLDDVLRWKLFNEERPHYKL